MESCHLADSIWTSRMERRRFPLRCFGNFPEHFTRASEIKPALGLQTVDCLEHVVGAVDVDGHGRKAIGETLGNEALCRKVIHFVERLAAKYLKNTGIALEAGCVQSQSCLLY